MKLRTLHEARHHIDQRDRFLRKFFILDVDEEEDDYQYQSWYPKGDFLVTIEHYKNGADMSIYRLVSGKKKTDGNWNDEVYPHDWDDPIQLQEGVQELKVWKRVA